MRGGSTKPGSIAYGVRDSPSHWHDHPAGYATCIAMLSVELVFPVVVATIAGGTVEMARDAVSLMNDCRGCGNHSSGAA